MSAAIIRRVLQRREATSKEAAEALSRQSFLSAAKGQQGEAGQQGEPGPMPRHEWQGTALRFELPEGKWGKAVDLKGEKGDDGQTRVIVRGGSRGSALETLLPGQSNVEPAGIAVFQAGQWANLPWAAFISVIAGAIDMGAELSRRSDFVGESLIYRGEAAPGASETAALWRIKKIEFAPDDDVTETWAGGNADFAQIWADRASLTYF